MHIQHPSDQRPKMRHQHTPQRPAPLPYSQESLTITHHPPNIRTATPPPTPRHTAVAIPRAHKTAPLHPQGLPPLQLPLQPERLLPLLSQIPLGALGLQLIGRVAALQFIDGSQEPLDLIAGLGNIVGELRVDSVAAVDLHLEVFDGAVDVADRAERLRLPGFLLFELFFEL